MRNLFAILTGCLFISTANAVTIDFESVPLTSDVGNYTALTTQGMNFQGIDQPFGGYNNGLIIYDENYSVNNQPTPPAPSGDRGLLLRTTGGGGNYVEPWVTMTAENGSAFDLGSFISGTDDEFRVRGYDDQSNLVAVAASTNYYGPEALLTSTDLGGGLSQYFFDSDWLGVTSVRIDGLIEPNFTGPYFIALDNIEVSVVPIPAAAWLFGSALAGLGWLRRKPTA